MSIFNNDDDLKAKLEAARIENEDLADRLENEQELRAQAESAVATMTKMRDPAQSKAIADAVAVQIEDTFARGFEGGHFADGWIGPAQMRRNAVAAIISETLASALMGGTP